MSDAAAPATRGFIDCDVHPDIPSVAALVPFLDDYWAELVVMRGMDRTVLNLNAYPPTAPISMRPDWRAAKPRGATSVAALAAHVLDPFGLEAAILNPLHGASVLHSADMAAALCTAVNRYIASHWLDQDSRLRASIVVPLEDPELAAAEIERWADDKRFVQVLLLAGMPAPLGKKRYWPIYAAAQRHDLAIGIHVGTTSRYPSAPTGWPSYLLEDYVNLASMSESQLVSLIGEGVFAKFPDLRVVFIESGFQWVPAALWRMNKTWRGVRPEVPWIRENPADIVRRHVRFTLQPVDAPPTPEQMAAVLEQLGSQDLLLYSSDYPHWQFDGMNVLPDGFEPALVRQIGQVNPLATYRRLRLPTRQEAPA